METMRFGRMVRVHGSYARKLFLAGKTVGLCPCNLMPGAPWHPECWVNLEMDEQRHLPEVAWDLIRAQFRFYNCTCNETGKYISYWIEEN